MLTRPPVNTPNALEIMLLKAAGSIYREYGTLTVNEARRRLSPFNYLVPCIGHVQFFESMRAREVTLVQDLNRRPVKQGRVFRHAFDVFGARCAWSQSTLGKLTDHVANAEAEARAACGNWELAQVSDEELEQLMQSLQGLSACFTGNEGFSLQLLQAAGALEQKARVAESAHERMNRLAAYQAFALENKAAMLDEREKAERWFEKCKARGSTVHLLPAYRFLDEVDQLVLTRRDCMA